MTNQNFPNAYNHNAFPPQYGDNQYPAPNNYNPNPQAQNIPQQVIYVASPTQPVTSQYLYNLPEKSLDLHCPYCNLTTTTKLSYQYNLCCLIFFWLALINSIVLFFTVSEEKVAGAIFAILFWMFLTYLSRGYYHLCFRCSRELGRGIPRNGCCTTTMD